MPWLDPASLQRPLLTVHLALHPSPHCCPSQVVAHRLQGQASPYAPYINNLPMAVPGLPMFYSGEALGALQYPPVTEQVKKRCRWLLTFSQQALAPVRGNEQADPFEAAEVDANGLGWALAVVTSRAFRTRGPNQPAAMLPLIDMANHSFQPNAKIAPGPGGSMCMVALRELRAGEPVLLCYGALPNDYLLLDYGFLVPGNPHDTVQLRFDRGLVEVKVRWAGREVVGSGLVHASSGAVLYLYLYRAAALLTVGWVELGPVKQRYQLLQGWDLQKRLVKGSRDAVQDGREAGVGVVGRPARHRACCALTGALIEVRWEGGA